MFLSLLLFLLANALITPNRVKTKTLDKLTVAIVSKQKFRSQE